jgi:hypothetical protein
MPRGSLVGAKRQVSAYARVLARHRLGKHPKVAGGFVGRELQEPLRSDSQEELTEAYLQAVKDGQHRCLGGGACFTVPTCTKSTLATVW